MTPRVLAAFLALTALHADEKKLTLDQRVELIRGLTAEYATVKVFLPRSRKALDYPADGKYDAKKWEAAGKEMGPAARIGDLVQVTKVDIGDDRITFEINGGAKQKTKWYQRIEVGMGGSTQPVNNPGATNAPGGTTIVLLFGKPLPQLAAADVKQILRPVLDFEKRTVTENYTESLPPEVQQAIKDKKAREGMDRDQVLLALGRPDTKTRETKDGLETEDWIYGRPPGKVVFVTFANSKVIKVKETYAGLGGTVAAPPRTP